MAPKWERKGRNSQSIGRIEYNLVKVAGIECCRMVVVVVEKTHTTGKIHCAVSTQRLGVRDGQSEGEREIAFTEKIE